MKGPGLWKLGQGLLAALLTVGCVAGPNKPDPGLTPVADALIRFAEDDGRRETRPGSVTGFLIVDIESFNRLGRPRTDSTTSAAALRKSLGKPVIDRTLKEAVICSPRSQDFCFVSNQGILIRLDSLVKTKTGFDALVSSITTDRRPQTWRSFICRRQHAIRLKPSGREWAVQASRLVLTC